MYTRTPVMTCMVLVLIRADASKGRRAPQDMMEVVSVDDRVSVLEVSFSPWKSLRQRSTTGDRNVSVVAYAA